jgi:nitrite reductase/ring-hydroxylating ferredoxin subunit
MTNTFKVAKVSDLKDGQMKEVEIPGTDGKVLLSRVKGNIYATGNRCTRTFYIVHENRC